MALVNIIQLRELLREKFPGLRTHADKLPVKRRDAWSTGLLRLDDLLGGGFPKSAISEVIASHRSCGSASLLVQCLQQAAENQFVALVDGVDSFDAASVEADVLEHVLWVRCQNADEAVKATDLILRDGNLPVVLLDLALNPEAQLRKIPTPTWYRFQRIVEQSTAVFVAITPRAMISPAQVRVTLRSRLDVNALERDQSELLTMLDFEVSEARRVSSGDELLRKSA
jgi:hypothetical protein